MAWRQFNPSASISNTWAPDPAPDFEGITGIGIWFENQRAAADTGGLEFQVGQITLNVVPEPSAALLMLLGVGVFMLKARLARRDDCRGRLAS